MNLFTKLYSLRDLMACHDDFRDIGVEHATDVSVVCWHSGDRQALVSLFSDGELRFTTFSPSTVIRRNLTLIGLAELLAGPPTIDDLARQDSRELAELVGF